MKSLALKASVGGLLVGTGVALIADAVSTMRMLTVIPNYLDHLISHSDINVDFAK